MPSVWRYGATAAFMILVVAAGILHGQYTYRWVPKPPLDAYVERLKAVPASFENWTSQDMPRFADDLRAHGIEDYIYRNYQNRNSTEHYRVFVVVGRHGAIASHTPDVCNRGAGFTAINDPKRADVPGLDANGVKTGRMYELFKMSFRPPATRAADAYEQDFRWAWMAPDKTLRAPSDARLEFPTAPALYKIYIIHDHPATAVSAATMPGLAPTPTGNEVQDPTKFLQAFLPRLEAALKDPIPKTSSP